ncbi:MAG: hypothetical protein ILA52_02855 [Alphaproteobacteria bacterium]|nr:hypothetical protein [Alphaproteobacteria bacterium]
MQKIYLAVIGVLVALLLAVNFKSSYQAEKINILQSDKNELEKQVGDYKNAVEKYSKAQEQAKVKIAKIRVAAHSEKADCNCYNQPLSADIISLFRNRHIAD